MYGILFNPEKYFIESKELFPTVKQNYISKIHPIHKKVEIIRNDINDICKMLFNIMYDFYSKLELEWCIIKNNVDNIKLKSLKECMFYNSFIEHESNEEIYKNRYNIDIENISRSSADELSLFIYNFYFEIKDNFKIIKDRLHLKNNSVISYQYIEDFYNKLNKINSLCEHLWRMLVKKILSIIELKRNLLDDIYKKKLHCFIVKNKKLLNTRVEFDIGEIKSKLPMFLYLNKNQKDNKFLVTYYDITLCQRISEKIDSNTIIFLS